MESGTKGRMEKRERREDRDSSQRQLKKNLTTGQYQAHSSARATSQRCCGAQKRQMWRSNKTILLLTRSQFFDLVVGQTPLSGRDSSTLYICMPTIAEVSLSAQVKITRADKLPLVGSRSRLMRGSWTRLGTSISPCSLRLCPHHTWSVTSLPHDPDLLPRYNPPPSIGAYLHLLSPTQLRI